MNTKISSCFNFDGKENPLCKIYRYPESCSCCTLFHVNHKVFNGNCTKCYPEYPVSCKCGGLIHAEIISSDDKFEYIDIKCEACHYKRSVSSKKVSNLEREIRLFNKSHMKGKTVYYGRRCSWTIPKRRRDKSNSYKFLLKRAKAEGLKELPMATLFPFTLYV